MLKSVNMSESQDRLHNGFSPENIDRIYHGQPALTDGQLPVQVLTKRQFQSISHYADGLPYQDITEKLGIAYETLGNHTHKGYKRLGIVKRSQLAGFFPLSPDSEAVGDNKLADLLEENPVVLDVLQAFSVGKQYAQIAAKYGVKERAIRDYVYSVNAIWPNTNDEVLATRIADALRACYVEVIETHPEAAEEINLPALTLPVLAQRESQLRRDFMDAPEPANLTAASP
jgi:DNA-binding CsgD family transcriptional regulator